MKSVGNNDKSAFITVAQLAEYCAISKKTVYKLVASGELKCKYFGRSIRFSKAYIRKYLGEDNNPNIEETNSSVKNEEL